MLYYNNHHSSVAIAKYKENCKGVQVSKDIVYCWLEVSDCEILMIIANRDCENYHDCHTMQTSTEVQTSKLLHIKLLAIASYMLLFHSDDN